MTKIPNHVGIIVDGNRRWAKEKKLPSFVGHKKGLERVKEVIKWCKNKGVKMLTLFLFSTENWKRAQGEVHLIMKLAKEAIIENLDELHKEKIKVRVIGERERLPKFLQEKIKNIEELTKNNKEMTLNFALSYGGRAEIVDAVKKIIEKGIPVQKIDENIISQNLWTSDLDFVIRTGKEQRISNFLIWQTAYSELYFSQKYWPDFTEKDLDEAFMEYARRQRRFGK